MLYERILEGRQRLVAAGFSPHAAAVDTEVLARHVLGWDRARLVAQQRDPEPPEFGACFLAAVERRRQREPVALITGHKEFWGRDFEVTRDTLIPRPETELLVEEALRRLPAGPATVIDVGTGTGCVAVAIASERPAARVIATDISRPALIVARRNAGRHGVSRRVRFVQTDLAAGLRTRADVIVSNPPYVPSGAVVSLVRDIVDYEPATALFGGEDGLRVFDRLFREIPPLLAEGGSLIVECGYGQDEDVLRLAERDGWTTRGLLHDLQGIARSLVLGRDRG